MRLNAVIISVNFTPCTNKIPVTRTKGVIKLIRFLNKLVLLDKYKSAGRSIMNSNFAQQANPQRKYAKENFLLKLQYIEPIANNNPYSIPEE